MIVNQTTHDGGNAGPYSPYFFAIRLYFADSFSLARSNKLPMIGQRVGPGGYGSDFGLARLQANHLRSMMVANKKRDEIINEWREVKEGVVRRPAITNGRGTK